MKKDSLNINKRFNAYPLFFYPIFKERIWGGAELKTLNKKLPKTPIGESWELSMVDDNQSIIKNGEYQDTSLYTILKEFPQEVLGSEIYNQFGTTFPLLFKFLDAKTDLSIQVHPDDAIAQKRHHSFGKTEMWYIIDATPGAEVIVGFSEDSNPEKFMNHLNNKTLPSILNRYPVKKGDAFLIKTGTIHAIGGGVLLAEIQQSSDITYRVYDWDRTDQDGNPRELHLDYALEAINFKSIDTKISYNQEPNTTNLIVANDYFTTNYIEINKPLKKQKKQKFYVYLCTAGEGKIIIDNQSYFFQKGDTFLIPAVVETFAFEGTTTLLEIFI